MRTRTVFLITAFLLVSIGLSDVFAQVQIGATITDEGLKGFYVAIGEYYRVPEREVIVIRERKIPDDEIPVVLLIAERARVKPAAVIELRLAGKSWMDIAFHFKLTAEIFYVELKRTPGPPYGKAYGYYRNTPRKEWGKIVLADADVVNLVNLKFVSEHYGHSPDEVIKLRAKGGTFVGIHSEVKKVKEVQKAKMKEKKEKRK